ncbi:unnamed protein product [Gongylonema pulchrum]|uniref:Helicase ATP-binding domain-containing protein n=1 Tax=Gongylonema pulchrum TaxID=637853 RepID=A0A3P7N194_9BILA|nr:unnamed protein product [Gongylonema pulchrum]
MEVEQWMTALHEKRPEKPRYPFVYDAAIESEPTLLTFDGVKRCLPSGSFRKTYTTYEEVCVPAINGSQIKEVDHINVSDLDELGRKCFEGIEKLNIIQSLVFNQAYKSRENLLICAPTGAGKTNIALLTVLNTVHGFMDQGVIYKDEFKIIYIAPMKALATEMTANFAKRLAPLGLKVRELTGDTTLTRKEIAETQVRLIPLQCNE